MGGDFEYKEVDNEGKLTLESVAQARRFNEWMYQSIRPFCNGRILEIGSGLGTISEYFIRDEYTIDLSDIRANYCVHLRKSFSKNRVLKLDLVHPDFETEYSKLLNSYDTVFALNVVEHIQDDKMAISNLHKLLKKGGSCIILVPAFQILYNSFDRELYHFRRYSRKQLNSLIGNNFTIKDSFYFNPIGILGWFVSGHLLKKKVIPSGQMSLFDRFVPVFKIINVVTRRIFGLSVVSVGRKQ